jgi:signal transduction histidine kinase/ligand-binding sensor domain-containing protein/CheY-like chemotaxis protein
VTIGSASTPDHSELKFRQQLWKTQQGLPQNTVPTVVRSKTGYIWLGTELGLVRFDGSRFFVFDKSNTPELESNVIQTLMEDHAGNLWIGTIGGGVTRLRNRDFQTFSLAQGLSSASVNAMVEDDSGDIWIGTDSGGINRFHDGHFQSFTTAMGLPDNQVSTLAKDKGGAIWVGTHNGLSRFVGGTFHNYSTADGLPNTYIRSLYMGRDSLWVGTYGGGLCRFSDGSFSCFSTRDGLSSNFVTSLHEDSSGMLWIATYGGGLNRFDGKNFSAYTRKDGLPSNDIWAVFEDRDHAFWVGTGGGGLVRLSNQSLFTTYDHRAGLSSDVILPIFEAQDGAMWMGTNGGGVNIYRNGQFSALTTKDGLADNLVFSIAEDKSGQMWIGTRNGLSRLNAGHFTTYGVRDGLPSQVVLATFTDSQDRLWLGTREGLTVFSDGVFKTYTTENGLGSNIVRAIFEDRAHRLWVGTGGGLGLFKDGRFQNYSVRNGLSNNVVLAIHEDPEGTLWIGTNGGGLNRFKNDRFTAYTIRNGLLDDAIFRILEDDSGNLWMSCDRGVFRVNRQQLNDFADKKLDRIETVSYGESDGMNTAECNGSFQPAGWKSRDGRLWFPTMQGAIVVDPRGGLGHTAPQNVTIDAVLINGQSGKKDGVQVPPGSGKLDFYYSTPNFRAPQRVKFRYRLVGFDREWVQAGTRHAAFYTNISPGSYRFEVTASNEEGVWSPQVASFQMELEPHFYQTALFCSVCIVTFVGLCVGAHFSHVLRLRDRERVLEHKVRERTAELSQEIAERKRTEEELLSAKEAAEKASRVKSEFLAHMSHEIRTPMNGILGMTELALTTDSKADQQDHLEVVRNSAESLLTLLNEILDLSKVEAGKLQLDLVNVDVRECLAGTVASMNVRAQQKGLRLLYTVHPGVPAVLRTDPVRLNQIVTNLLSNAVKFTSAGEVELYIRCQSRDASGAHLHFTVRDTGIGLRQDQLKSIFEAFSQADSSITRHFGGTGLGLAICNRLVGLMSGEIWAESELDCGSEFHFTVTCEEVASDAAVSRYAPYARESWRQAKLSIPKVEHWHVLVAEDNPANRKVAKASLLRAGFQVTEVEDGLQALEAVKAFPYDAVLMDCSMPGMDGYLATRLIRQLPGPESRVPIIALTASAFKEDRDKAHAAGMNDFISKPYHAWALVAKCVQLIKAKPAPEDPPNGISAPQPDGEADEDEDEEFKREIMQVFLAEAPPVFEKLSRALQNENWEEARISAHWLQGGAARLVNPEFQQQLRQMEALCRQASPDVQAADQQSLAAAFDTAIRNAKACVHRPATLSAHC